MQTAWQSIANGGAGIGQILAQLDAQKNYYGGLPCIRAAALVIASPSGNNDNGGNAQKLAEFVRAAVCYVTDPVNSELTQTPDLLLLTINRDGQAFGDCDDHVLLFASLCESLGIACDIAAVQSPGSTTYDHVIAVCQIGGEARQFDLCAKLGAIAPQYFAAVTAEDFAGISLNQSLSIFD